MPNTVNIQTTKITKSAMFTDIHWGCRGNSLQHNTDCLNFINWFKDKVIEEKCSHIFFLGDWFENRNSINVMTMDLSYQGLKILNEIGLPIFMCVGNHDLYNRHNRDIHSISYFNEFSNVTVVKKPVTLNTEFLFCPYLFNDEYTKYAGEISKAKYVFGHFEFRNFILTGTSRMMEHGPRHEVFNQPKYIFSGHYHRRQSRDNVVYIGNPFPTNYGDAGDFNRGMCLCNHETEEVYFYDWEEAPVFLRAKLSNVLDGNFDFYPNARVKCLIDIEITYTEAQILKEAMLKDFQLREFILEENALDRNDMLTQENEEMEDLDFSSIKETVRNLLSTGINNTATINSEKLIAIWNEL